MQCQCDGDADGDDPAAAPSHACPASATTLTYLFSERPKGWHALTSIHIYSYIAQWWHVPPLALPHPPLALALVLNTPLPLACLGMAISYGLRPWPCPCPCSARGHAMDRQAGCHDGVMPCPWGMTTLSRGHTHDTDIDISSCHMPLDKCLVMCNALRLLTSDCRYLMGMFVLLPMSFLLPYLFVHLCGHWAVGIEC